MLLQNKVALVTGASRGIGAATAKILAERGAKVALTARTVADLESVSSVINQAGGEALVLPANILDSKQVSTAVETLLRTWKRIDILINNAGLGTPIAPVEEIGEEDWDQTVALNLKSAFLCTRAVAPYMKKQRYGRIVNVSSYAGRNYSLISGPQYSSAKAGLLGFTKHMAAELGPYGICVNAVAPSIVLTARVQAKWEARSAEEQRTILSRIPLRRLAQPEEVAKVIAFLASDDASYVNGVCVDINGGSYMV